MEQPIQPKPGQQPPPPKMYNGVQGISLVLILIAAVIGWVLYINLLYETPISEENPNTNTTNTVISNTNQTITYTAIPKTYTKEAQTLPTPQKTGTVSVEETLANRRSAREFSETTLTQVQLGQMLWAAQGVTSDTGGRTAPSARSIYPYNLYVIVRNVEGVTPGLYHYIPESHSIRQLIASENLLTDESQQAAVKQAPAVLVYGAIFTKTQEKFPELESAKQVTLQESGHIGQNVYLQAVSLGLGTVVVGGFDEAAVADALSLPMDETAVYLQPFGVVTE